MGNCASIEPRLCSHEGCDAKTISVNYNHCMKHIPRTCEFKGKYIRPDGETGYYHGRYSKGCRKSLKGTENYCKEHTCAVKGCNFEVKCTYYSPNYDPKYPGGSLLLHTMCDRHYCHAKIVYNNILVTHSVCEEQRIAGTDFCKYHTCGIHLCYNETRNYHQFCERHTCDVRGCRLSVNHGFRYCLRHICQHESCHLTKTADSIYCKDHTCSHVGCQMAKGVKEMYCYDHTEPPSYESKVAERV